MQTVYLGNALINDVMLGSQRMDDVLQNFTGNDPNVRNFVVATGITNQSTIIALDNLANNLKSNNLWDKLYAVYPFVGATQKSNKYNLVNTGSYTLGFTGSWAYSNDGIGANGTDTFANTFFIPTSSVSDYTKNSSLAFYVRTNSTSSGYDAGCETNNPVTSRTYFISKNGANKAQYDIGLNALNSSTDVTGSGFWVATVSGSATNNQRIFRNGTTIVSQTNNISDTPDVNLYLAANNFRNTSVNSYTSESYSYFSIGKGFTDSEVSSYNTIIQAFQTELNRQV